MYTCFNVKNTTTILIFAIVTCSHLLGDGHTYYTLYGSLNSGVQPTQLEVHRNFEADKKGVEAVRSLCSTEDFLS